MKSPFAGTSRAALVERARGAFLGAALGDALGATVEFMSVAEIRHKYGIHREMTGGGWLYLKPGQVTDDTEMALCVARAIAEEGTLDPRLLAEHFAAWWLTNPIDIGSTCLAGIRNYLNFGNTQAPPSLSHGGNGAAMRMPAVAIATLGSDALLCQWAVAQAHVTHNHPLSDDACIAIGRLAHAGLACEGVDEMRRIADELVAAHPEFAYQPYNGKASGYIAETLATALHFLFTTQTFEECLTLTVNQGQDADTTGAIAGLLAGARYGLDGLPRRWLGRLDPKVRQEINLLAEKLVALEAGRGG